MNTNAVPFQPPNPDSLQLVQSSFSAPYIPNMYQGQVDMMQNQN